MRKLSLLFLSLVFVLVACDSNDPEFDYSGYQKLDCVSLPRVNPTSALVLDDGVVVISSGDYVKDGYEYKEQSNSGITVWDYSLKDSTPDSLKDLSGKEDFGSITECGNSYYIGSLYSGDVWVLDKEFNLTEYDKKYFGATIPFCAEGKLAVLEQNTGKVDGLDFDVSISGVGYPWFVSPSYRDGVLSILDSSSSKLLKVASTGTTSVSLNTQYPSAMIEKDGVYYVLDSMNNTVIRVADTVDYNYIDLGVDTNPYYASFYNNEIYIVGNMSGLVYKFDVDKNMVSVLNEIRLDSPTFVQNLVVLDSEYSSTGSKGKLCVIK